MDAKDQWSLCRELRPHLFVFREDDAVFKSLERPDLSLGPRQKSQQEQCRAETMVKLLVKHLVSKGCSRMVKPRPKADMMSLAPRVQFLETLEPAWRMFQMPEFSMWMTSRKWWQEAARAEILIKKELATSHGANYQNVASFCGGDMVEKDQDAP
ncbi:hypothetical protein SELMODRAFT_417688 [Selaginella moellendorffii]|uniref:Uncharacterized protein n=1 Tax=Selaginella moellendorffii TaxID=88036 RepID=D8S398_SELML|nr:hypothetical protein SELMODRAFT_417688 [Selaginella moellendorffii]